MNPALDRRAATRALLLARPIAHRGLHGPDAPENGRAAIAAAVEAGYAVELDVTSSADGEAMVFHDDTLERLTTERGPVAARSAAELGLLRLAGGLETMPTLAEILALVAGRTTLVIELKATPRRREDGATLRPDDRLAARVARLLAGYDGPAAVMSFDPRAVGAMARLAPDRPRGLVSYAWDDVAEPAPERRAALAALADLDGVAADFVSYDWTALPTPVTARRRSEGLPVISWTIRSSAEAEAALRHSDQITFEHFRPALAR